MFSSAVLQKQSTYYYSPVWNEKGGNSSGREVAMNRGIIRML